MSAENVELHRRALAAFNARDADALVALCDLSVEWSSAMTVPGGSDYRGHEGVRKWLRDLEDAWGEELSAEPEAFFDLGERTLAFTLVRGEGRQSGAEVAMPIAQAVQWRDGLAVRYRSYADREEALRDLAISADELEPIAP